MYQKLKGNKKGFTLAELLIVVAIIAVLVAIAIPAFSGSLNRAKEATDKANIRSAYAEYQVALLDGGDEIKTAEEATAYVISKSGPLQICKSVSINQSTGMWEGVTEEIADQGPLG